MIDHFEWLMCITSSARAKCVNKLILSLKNMAHHLMGDTRSIGHYFSMCNVITLCGVIMSHAI